MVKWDDLKLDIKIKICLVALPIDLAIVAEGYNSEYLHAYDSIYKEHQQDQ